MNSWNEWKEKQPYVTKLLLNSIKKNRLAHAYLFTGEAGVGKKEMTLLLAKTLFCKHLNKLEPCQRCRDCRRIDSNNHPGVHLISSDSRSIKIEQIRDLKKDHSYRGIESNRKVYIIEEAERFTKEAANSFLKVLEEPTKETTIVLLSVQVQQLLPTIVSRCQRVAFRPLPKRTLYEKLTSELVPHSRARLIALLTDDVDTAKSWSEDEWFAQTQNIVIQLAEELLERPESVFFVIQDRWMAHFQDREQMKIGLHLLMIWFRDVLLLHVGQKEKIVFLDEQDQLERFRARYTIKLLNKQLETMVKALKRLDANVNPQLVIEQALLKEVVETDR